MIVAAGFLVGALALLFFACKTTNLFSIATNWLLVTSLCIEAAALTTLS